MEPYLSQTIVLQHDLKMIGNIVRLDKLTECIDTDILLVLFVVAFAKDLFHLSLLFTLGYKCLLDYRHKRHGSVLWLLWMCQVLLYSITAYSRLTDKVSEKYESLYFLSVYNGRTLTEDIRTLAKKYDCCGFFVIYESGECEKEIYCCTDGDQKEIKRKLGIDQCSFDTITELTAFIEASEQK